MASEHFPQTLLEAVQYYSNPDNCIKTMVAMRWPNGVTCPRCGSREVTYLANDRRWKCRNQHPSQKFSVKVGTIMEDSPIGLDKWLPAIWLITNAKNGISSYELHRALGVTQKTAWFMLHRIRMAMHDKEPGMFSGQIEADETYIGGLARNMHKSKRERVITGTGGAGKTVVMGLLERHTDPKNKEKVIDSLDYDPKKSKKASRVKVTVVPDTKRKTLQAEIRSNVEAGSEVFTENVSLASCLLLRGSVLPIRNSLGVKPKHPSRKGKETTPPGKTARVSLLFTRLALFSPRRVHDFGLLRLKGENEANALFRRVCGFDNFRPPAHQFAYLHPVTL